MEIQTYFYRPAYPLMYDDQAQRCRVRMADAGFGLDVPCGWNHCCRYPVTPQGLPISAQRSFPTSRKTSNRWKETTGIQAFFDGVLGSLATGGSYAETLRIPVASQRPVDGEREGEKKQRTEMSRKRTVPLLPLLRHIRSCLSPLPYQLTQTGTLLVTYRRFPASPAWVKGCRHATFI